ncbi:hypothetical protein [Helicobacter trogontum]|uniref:hypothetical protein n=1 Tax=Helicobacter trogontum TaxID=50960 RepID=UPI001F1932CD|nr:hypothetical protein [Helicobacter trogontum]
MINSQKKYRIFCKKIKDILMFCDMLKYYLHVVLLFMFGNTGYLFSQNYGGNYDWRMLGGGPLQLVSFHIGTSTSINRNFTGYNLGGSVGWNYLSSFYNAFEGVDHIFDMGIRFKYMFNDSAIKSHLIGTELYFHFPCSTTNLFRHAPQPISLVVGGGAIFAEHNTTRLQNLSLGETTGYYVEVGIGLFKYFVINANLLYRASFFQSNTLNIQPIEHNLLVEFAIF